MAKPVPEPFKVAVVWRGNAQARAEARPETSRFKAIFEALERGASPHSLRRERRGPPSYPPNGSGQMPRNGPTQVPLKQRK